MKRAKKQSPKASKKNIQATAMSPPPIPPSRTHLALDDNPTVIKGEVKELHTCMGLNSCKDKGHSGNNACAGRGDCATVVHSCHTLNECKGQGGCGLFGTTAEFCHPGENDCKYQGSCGSPIIASRFIVDGPNTGLSVWQLARKRFEKRQAAKGKTVGPPPAGMPYGPTLEFVNARSMGSSCGASGSRYCSYAFTKAEKDKKCFERRQEFMKKSSETPYSSEGCS